MKILIDIKTDNLPRPPEDCARILRKLADSLIVHGDAIDDPGLLSALYDINGNCVGAVEVVDDDKARERYSGNNKIHPDRIGWDGEALSE